VEQKQERVGDEIISTGIIVKKSKSKSKRIRIPIHTFSTFMLSLMLGSLFYTFAVDEHHARCC
jgi:hypothetical protein